MISNITSSMIQIYIFADSHKHFSESIQEYIKRLGKKVKIIELKPVKNGTSKQIISTETQEMIQKLQKDNSYRIVLSPTGKSMSTENINTLIENQKNRWNKMSFVIWWANGLDYTALRPYVDTELSLGKMTLPHSLALTVLLEQIYRCSEIEKGSKYHK